MSGLIIYLVDITNVWCGDVGLLSSATVAAAKSAVTPVIPRDEMVESVVV